MLPIIAGIINALVVNNLPKLAQAVATKGTEYVESKLGVKLSPDMTPAEIEAVRELAQKHEEFVIGAATALAATEAKELTGRLQADMSSDSWLSKNVRPITLIYILTAYLVLALLDGSGFKIAESYVSLLGQWGMLVMSFYFGGRSLEKVFDLIGKAKK